MLSMPSPENPKPQSVIAATDSLSEMLTRHGAKIVERRVKTFETRVGRAAPKAEPPIDPSPTVEPNQTSEMDPNPNNEYGQPPGIEFSPANEEIPQMDPANDKPEPNPEIDPTIAEPKETPQMDDNNVELETTPEIEPTYVAEEQDPPLTVDGAWVKGARVKEGTNDIYLDSPSKYIFPNINDKKIELEFDSVNGEMKFNVVSKPADAPNQN